MEKKTKSETDKQTDNRISEVTLCALATEIAHTMGGKKNVLQYKSILVFFSPDKEAPSPIRLFVTKREYTECDKITILVEHYQPDIRYGTKLWSKLSAWAKTHNAYFRYIKRGQGFDIYSLDKFPK